MEEDKTTQVTAETDSVSVTVKTQLLREPGRTVILITEKTLDKKTGKSLTKIVYRREI